MFVAVSSDRGLCGGVHSTVTKMIRKLLKAQKNEGSIVVLGDKARNQLAREYKSNIRLNVNQLGKNIPTFYEASLITDLILKEKTTKDSPKIALVYNQFKSAIAYEVQLHSLPTLTDLRSSPKLAMYESSSETLDHFAQFLHASEVYYAMAEGHASEISSRRTAMDNATKNAGDIIDNLRMKYNRQRQASITNELVDIITGASAI
ncbi:atp3 gamma subunit of the F1 sector of mitochondrial F1F0 ATP synthase [Coelomomyces lativittatus]|nr:atp3 gamma subunit of the F1 sector of mitochondrial F1F0 ATP synthase [Coelomomyces lativittatus]